ncbi:MAG: hypothetical protein BIFFINMI_02235 [Phycisphaerae bacterium]|nr:hypothetical protein [Phycisphaerae bacterium]
MTHRLRIAPALLALLLIPSIASALTLDDLSRATVAITCRASSGPGGYLGTGIVIHPAGYVLTSTTVVPPGALDIRCNFVGALNRPARLVVADEKLELALIKVDAKDLPDRVQAVTLRRSKGIEVGDTVFSIGDAFVAFVQSGRFTVSFGIISGRYKLTRELAPQPVYEGEAFETTATMAAGMDGGPLLDGSGQFIGLLSLNVSDARWLGMAVPVDAFLDKLTAAMKDDAAKNKVGDAQPRVADAPGKPMFPRREYQDRLFRASADKVAPSVVAIEVDRKAERKVAGRTPRPQPMAGGPQGPYAEILKRPKAPVTGIVVSSEGHILTSYFNVWGELNGMKVVLPDGQSADARLLGYDEHHDLAMIKIDPAALKSPAALVPITFSPDPLVVGSPVAAIGRSPEPAQFTLTSGIVSATGRLRNTAVQVDAALDYGNAGGPLIDEAGHCVGVVSFVRPDAVWSQNSGVGFAITAKSVRTVMARLKKGAVVEKPKSGFLGIQMSAGDVDTRGVVVEQVLPDSPAAEAGLKPRDLITEIDGQAVSDPADLGEIILARKPGTEVTLTVKRGDKTDKVKVTLAEHPYQ